MPWGSTKLVLGFVFSHKIYGTLLGATFGCHFWTPFWWPNSGTIFGSIFQPPFWGSKMVQILQKFLLSMRKFGYSEHCVYTGAMLSFIYSLFGFWEFIVWSEGFRRCIFWYSYYGCFLEDWFWGT